MYQKFFICLLFLGWSCLVFGQFSNEDVKGDWQLMHKIVNGEKEFIYVTHYQYGTNESIGKGLDTLTIHRYAQAGELLRFATMTQDLNGFVIPDPLPSHGTWRITEEAGFNYIILKDIYFKNSGYITRRIDKLNLKEMILTDEETNIGYYFKRKK